MKNSKDTSIKKFVFFLFLIPSVVFADNIKLSKIESSFFSSNTIEIPVKFIVQQNPGPTIILGHACGGPNHLRDWPKIIHSWGYNVLIPHSLIGRGYKSICGNIEKVSPKIRADDIQTVIEWVEQQSWHSGKIGYIGFSHGAVVGQYISNHTTNKKISAIVNFYPKCNYYNENDPKVPTQINIGGLDEWTPASLCYNLNHKNYQIHYYENAHHGFDQDRKTIVINGKTLISYNHVAYMQSINHTYSFIKKYVY
jgi:dienelactone hydrolase